MLWLQLFMVLKESQCQAKMYVFSSV